MAAEEQKAEVPELYKPPKMRRLANPKENARVREMVLREVDVIVAADNRSVSLKKKHGTAHTVLATGWWEIADKEAGILKPGADQRAPAGPGVDVRKRQIGAGHTSIRHLVAGALLYDWMLIGIESAVCVRHGMQLPAGAYRSQQALDL